jgi:hypothetical protein
MRGWPAWLSVSPTMSTVSASAAILSRTRSASGVAGSEISTEMRAGNGINRRLTANQRRRVRIFLT